MIVGLLHIELEPQSGAGNMQRILRAIEEGARVDPAPDLLVLPGACDTGGVPIDRAFPEARLLGLREGIAAKAKEWGIFIAAGLHERVEGDYGLSAVMFDPDGDLICRAGDPTLDVNPLEPVPVQTSTVAGDFGVFEPSASAPLEGAFTVEPRGAFVALPLGLSKLAKMRRVGESNLEAIRNVRSARGGAHWGVVRAFKPGQGEAATKRVGAFVCDPEGKVLASAPCGEPCQLFAEVAIEPAAADENETKGEGGRRAD